MKKVRPGGWRFVASSLKKKKNCFLYLPISKGDLLWESVIVMVPIWVSNEIEKVITTTDYKGIIKLTIELVYICNNIKGKI